MVEARKIELLAPAKNLETGIEAIKHGADAVYIGAPRFSARSAAGCSVDDIRELCAFAHLYDVKIYVALNTILYEEELEEAEKIIHELYQSGVDALIVQDMGITRLNLPPIPLHASTQAENSTPEKVAFLEQAGFTQVVLARELSLNEIAQVSAQTSVKLEAFVHGALCVSYSGNCYLSAAFSDRSANRGACAQYCRLPYTLMDANGEVIIRDKHLLSLKDMNQSDHLLEMLEAGVSSFKIEGRLKDIAYVKNITAHYRKKLDEIFARNPRYVRSSIGQSTYNFTPQPNKSFNRGFTSFFLHGRGEDITAFDSPKSIGEPVGKVKEIRGKTFTVAGLASLNNGDGLAFHNEKGELIGFRVNRVENNRVFPAEMPVIQPKTPLYRNYDHAFERLLEKETAERKIAVDIEWFDHAFGFSLVMTDETEAQVIINRSFEKSLARKPQTDNIKTQLSKLGNTPFEAHAVDIRMTEEYFVPSSLLSDMRREAVEKLIACRLIRYNREVVHPARYKQTAELPQKQISYLGNVSNSKAKSFYYAHGATSVADAFELAPDKRQPLMITKHCLRYSLGYCPVYQKKKAPYQEPYYLVHKDMKLELQFDCRQCRMLVLEAKE